MRNLLLAASLVVLTACGGGGGAAAGGGSGDKVLSLSDVSVQSAQFAPASVIVGGGYMVESELFAAGAGYDIFHQCEDNRVCRVMRADLDNQTTSRPLLPGVCRYPFLFRDPAAPAISYLLCVPDREHGDVYLYTSVDLAQWTLANGGQPILRESATWPRIANPSITVIGSRWHMLTETNGGLAYSYADAAAVMDFTPNQVSTPVIDKGGNAHLFMRAGKLTAVHGMYKDSYFGGNWYVTMSEADPASPLAWTTRRDLLLVGQNGIDVADPSYLDFHGVGLLTVSYDQIGVVVLRGPAL